MTYTPHANFNGQDSYSTPVAYAETPFGQVAGNIPLRSPADNYFFGGGVDYAMTKDQVLRVNFQGSQFSRGNVGIETRSFRVVPPSTPGTKLSQGRPTTASTGFSLGVSSRPNAR